MVPPEPGFSNSTSLSGGLVTVKFALTRMALYRLGVEEFRVELYGLFDVVDVEC